MQKDILKQDIFLIGVPGFLRTQLVLQYLVGKNFMSLKHVMTLQELCNREFEYLPITRDTTEADIKQRREIRSGNAFYSDLVKNSCLV